MVVLIKQIADLAGRQDKSEAKTKITNLYDEFRNKFIQEKTVAGSGPKGARALRATEKPQDGLGKSPRCFEATTNTKGFKSRRISTE